MHVQQASAQEPSHNQHHPALPDFESSFASYSGRAAAVSPAAVKRVQARQAKQQSKSARR